MIRKNICSSDSYIDFTVGTDATVLVQSWQMLESNGEIVGGSYPNRFLGVTNRSDDESVNLIK